MESPRLDARADSAPAPYLSATARLDTVSQAAKAQRIALIFHDFSTGGSERIAIRLANAWAALGRDVTIFAGTEEGKARALVDARVRIIAADPPITRSATSRFTLGFWLSRMVDTHRPDLVFSPGNFHLVSLTIAAHRQRHSHTRFVSKLSNPLLPKTGSTPFAAMLGVAIARLIRSLDGLIAISPALAENKRRLLRDDRIIHIDQPVFDHRPEPRARTAQSCAAPLIVAIGRLEGQKDFPLALRAFAELSPISHANLVILGEGPDRAALEAEAQRLGIADRVSLPGHVRDVRAWLDKACLFLMSSRYEGYPSVLVEANAAGVPVVTTNCSPAIPEIIDSPIKGTIVHSRDPQALAAAMAARINAPASEPALVAKGTGKYVMDRIAPEYLAYFDRLVSTPSAVKDGGR